MAKYISLNIFIIYFHIRYIFSFTFLLQTATINNEHYQTVHPPPPPIPNVTPPISSIYPFQAKISHRPQHSHVWVFSHIKLIQPSYEGVI